MKFSNDIDFASSVVGGIIIGISATFFLLITGKLSGISGIVEDSMVPVPDKNKSWTMSYLAGMILSGLVAYWSNQDKLLNVESEVEIDSLIAGILVGFGTRMGSGCTSGHGNINDIVLYSNQLTLHYRTINRNLRIVSVFSTICCGCWQLHDEWVAVLICWKSASK
jgi:hypothetical protein